MALLAIRGYQRWVSPYKGFRCAHSVLHGGPGCSGYAMQAIRARGLVGAIGAIRLRFRDCRAAYEVISAGLTDGGGNDDRGQAANQSPVRKKGSDSPCAGLHCSPCTNRRHAACWAGGEGGAAACSACDLGAISCCG